MSEAPDPLEAELSALRPHEPSPGLRRRLAERLPDAPPVKHRWPWRLALAGLAAACLAVTLFRWAGRGRVEPRPIVRIVPAAEDAEPTLLAYQRALAHSPEELDALLDSQAVTESGADAELVPISAAALHDLLGED